MKATEINFGDVVAVTEGAGRYHRTPEGATKAKVVSKPEGGYVNIELLEKPKSRLGRRGFMADPYKMGDCVRVKTGWLWVPWPEIAVMAEAARERKAHAAKLDAEREERRAALQARVDAVAGEKIHLHWPWRGGGAEVEISVEGLELLLAKAEGS